ncbi:MAG: DNA topoisomerase VI subunit B [Thermoguttaceae bacterium]|jgi:DNA topoisomerase-6 subunit B|nr:DNA topoisomerase VI subunit B [Thermoguttaceae bacterium]
MTERVQGVDAGVKPVPLAPPGPNGQGNGEAPRRRATAHSMAASQRDISVSEFFAKNRHLLGFDNPRKALLTTVKEAVDNALDACEEAGILPEVWVHVRSTGENRFQVAVQDNGPGILKKTIPLIFGKLLYGSKFHRLRMSRGQQGIGISAAGMYGLLTTGKPVKIMSKIDKGKPAHYYEIQIDTKRNEPEILNGKGEGDEIPCGERGRQAIEKLGIEWVEVEHGTRVTIELEARFQRGRGSVDEYLEQTALANPHVTLHYMDPEGQEKHYLRVAETLPPEPKEIKPHPYGVELGMLVAMLKDAKASTLSQFLTTSFSRVSAGVARRICEAAGLSPRASVRKIGRHEADALYKAIQETRIPAPATDCISPIGEELLLKGLHQLVPGEFYAAATRPPAVYRGNPFQIEVGLAYGGAPATHRVPKETLVELLSQSDARTLRQFLATTFDGLGVEAADQILHTAKLRRRMSPGKLKEAEIDRLHEAMQNVSLNDRQTMTVLRYANRVPLLFQAGACAITQTVMQTNWRAYGLSQSRGALPSGPVTVMVHIASVWVPFTSESKEAVAGYPEIQKELRLALQAVGRKLGMYLKRRQKARHEGERRNLFLRYLGEVATAVSRINRTDRDALYEQLLKVAKRKTAEADAKYDERGQRIDEEEDLGEHVLIVERATSPTPVPAACVAPAEHPEVAEVDDEID